MSFACVANPAMKPARMARSSASASPVGAGQPEQDQRAIAEQCSLDADEAVSRVRRTIAGRGPDQVVVRTADYSKRNAETTAPITSSRRTCLPRSAPAAPATTINGRRCSSRGWLCRAIGARDQRPATRRVRSPPRPRPRQPVVEAGGHVARRRGHEPAHVVVAHPAPHDEDPFVAERRQSARPIARCSAGSSPARARAGRSGCEAPDTRPSAG